MQTLVNFKGQPSGATGDYHDEWQVDYFDEDPWGRKLREPILGIRCRIMQESGEFTEWSTWLVPDGLLSALEEQKNG